MRCAFPKYNKKALKPLYEKFKPKDKKAIEEFLVFCGGTAGKTTINKYRSVLIKICDVFGGDLDKIDLKRLREFLNVVNQSELLPPTKNEIRKVLKRFLRETYDDWSSRFKGLSDIKGQAEINQDKINANTILRNEEIEQLVRGCKDLRYKAMIMLFYESAGRPEEILKLKWRDLDLNKGDVKLQSSKTGNTRINPIKGAVFHLKRHKEEYFYSDVRADDYVFPSPYDRNKHQHLVGVGLYIKRLGYRVLGRHIFPYLFRHSRATHLQKVLPAKVYEKFMDHSIETATRYSHLNKDDVRAAMFKNVYEVNEISEEEENELKKEIQQLKQKYSQEQKEREKIKAQLLEIFNQLKIDVGIKVPVLNKNV
ncbi:MAG: tyrosine-type recombinase/integrase [Candidatus Heimdallarchaeaceae archaeon]